MQRATNGDLKTACALMLHWRRRDMPGMTGLLADVTDIQGLRDVVVALLTLSDIDPTDDMLSRIITKSLLAS